MDDSDLQKEIDFWFLKKRLYLINLKNDSGHAESINILVEKIDKKLEKLIKKLNGEND